MSFVLNSLQFISLAKLCTL